jgi:pimeloyl-ACP methyl ester carboxylesterase
MRRGVPEFTRDGVELHYEVHGDGEPVVLLHGFTSLARTWERNGWVDALLADEFQAIALDTRSHGGSSRVFEAAACATDALAGDVVSLLDHLATRAASVIGFSMGGGIALELAFGWPSRVRKLVIAGVGDAAINDLHDPAEVAAIAEAFSNPSMEPPEGSQAARIRRNAVGAGNDVRALLPFLQLGGWPGGLRSVTRLTMPTLVIVADEDEYMASTRRLVAALGPSDVLRLRGKGHHQVMRDDHAKQAAIDFLRSRRV